MEPLAMVVRNEFIDHVAQVPFSEQDEMVQTLVENVSITSLSSASGTCTES